MGRISPKMTPKEILAIKRGEYALSRIPADGRWVAVIRIRGTVNVRNDVALTLRLLRLNKPHHMVIIPLTESYKGMLQKANHMIAWGEISFETFLKLLRKRGRVVGGKRLSDEIVSQFSNGKYRNIEELARALWDRKVSWKEISWLKQVFRLHPPRGGYRGTIKRSYAEGGSFGYWGARINELILKMM